MRNKALTPLDRFWRLLKPDRKEIKNVYVYAVFTGLISMSLPLGISAIINLIQGGQISTSWIVLVVVVILGIAVTGILQILQLRITENLQQKIFARAAFDFAYRIPRIRLDELYKQYAPELANRFFDILTVQKGLSKILIDFSSASLQILFGLILLCLYHPFFIIFSLALILLVFVIIKFTAQKGLDASLKESKYKYKIAHWLEELARTNITFKLAGNSKIPLERMDGKVGEYIKYRDVHFGVLVQQYSLMIIFKVLVATGLLAIGGVLVFEQQMNIGQFVGAEIIILIVLGSVEKLIMSLETIYDVLTGLEKMGQLTDMGLDNPNGVSMVKNEYPAGLKVELADVSFSYPGHYKSTLVNFNLAVESGSTVMVTGNNSSGKSTMLSILSGLFHPQFGNLSFNGLPKGNIDLNELRTLIGNCADAEQLFEGTLLENISLGREAATFENVKWATENVGLSDFLKKQPLGFDTELEPEGRHLSSSIIQKIILARSIAHKPKLLLLKDALLYLIQSEREKIIDFLTSKEHGWTLIAVSSDIYLAKKCDKLVVISEGTVEHEGTYEQLKDLDQLKKITHA